MRKDKSAFKTACSKIVVSSSIQRSKEDWTIWLGLDFTSQLASDRLNLVFAIHLRKMDGMSHLSRVKAVQIRLRDKYGLPPSKFEAGFRIPDISFNHEHMIQQLESRSHPPVGSLILSPVHRNILLRCNLHRLKHRFRLLPQPLSREPPCLPES